MRSRPTPLRRALRDFGATPALPLALAAAGGCVALAVFRVRDGWLAYGGTLAALLVTTGLAVYPRIDDVRSGRAFMAKVEQASAGFAELGLVGAREQYLLELRRPSYNFGHARWREREAEAADAAAWFAARPGRALLVQENDARDSASRACRSQELGRANRAEWFLVTGGTVDAGLCRARRPAPGPALHSAECVNKFSALA